MAKCGNKPALAPQRLSFCVLVAADSAADALQETDGLPLVEFLQRLGLASLDIKREYDGAALLLREQSSVSALGFSRAAVPPAGTRL